MKSDVSSALLDALLLLDGGMGQELLRRGLETRDHSLWSANALLTDPELVREVHADYLRAGADIITTNTYATPRERLEEAGLGERVAELNRTAGRLAEQARDAVGTEAFIAGSLPPIRGSYRPDLVGTYEEIMPQYREQAEILAPYVDLFLCETMSTTEEARAAATGAASTDKPVLVSYTIEDTSSDESPPALRSGTPLTTALEAGADLPVDGFLINCSSPESITAAMPMLRQSTDRPVGGYANAFATVPTDWNEQADPLPEKRTDLGPNAYAAYVRRWLDDGAQIVGGCCEVGPEHIKYLRQLVDEARSSAG